MFSKNLIPTTIAILSISSAAFADQPLCGVTDTAALDLYAELLEGQWTSEFKPGYVMLGGLAMPHGAAPSPETGRFEIQEGRLTIIPDSSEGMNLSFDWETEVDWSFDNQPSIPEFVLGSVPPLGISDTDLSTVVGCDVNDLPRLVGAASIPIEGGQMTFILRLIVVNSEIIYGFQQVHGLVNGQSMVERRPFVMTR